MMSQMGSQWMTDQGKIAGPWTRHIGKSAIAIPSAILLGLLSGCQPSPSDIAHFEPDEPTRMVEHAMGTTQVSTTPKRVVVIDTTPLDAALALDIKPVGTIRYGTPPSYLEDVVQDIEVVGEYNQPNMETILKLDPDLILGAKSISERLYPRLSRIAPTVFIEGAGRSWDWQNNFRIYAEALGKSEQAETLIEDYQKQLETLQSLFVIPIESITVSVLVVSNRDLIAHTPTSFSGSILQDIGFARNAIQRNDDQFFVRLSREDLDGPDGDVLFLVHNSEWDTLSKSEFIENPLWSELNAVQQGAVCEVNGDVWGSGRSILAAQQILNDVQTCLLPAVQL